MRRLAWAAAALPALALGAAACGGGGSGGGYGSAPKASAPPTAAAAVVAVHDSKLGTILTDSQGRTLYLFEKDTPTASHCDGTCATAWPPLTTTGTPHAGTGVSAADLGTVTRADHSMEVTYHGHPLYYFAGDHRPGDTNGEGSTAFGAGWYVLDPSGNKINNG
ncbi:hypothetical protein ACFYNO_17920 [Kitasatospora sp. NPDC006697]|uniref:COG4315 family predicted lipoprotein n=1 Tax=Kitasatospora sp. NPDC006697 TaxID=3364020 RepID=UPI0036AEAFAA